LEEVQGLLRPVRSDETNTRSPVANLPAASPLSHIALSENPKEITHQEDYQYRA
jgi:hypothetical protein